MSDHSPLFEAIALLRMARDELNAIRADGEEVTEEHVSSAVALASIEAFLTRIKGKQP